MRKSALYGMFISVLVINCLFIHRGDALFFLIGLLIAAITTAISIAEMFQKEKKIHREYQPREYAKKAKMYRAAYQNREYDIKPFKANVPCERKLPMLPMIKPYF